MSIPVENYKKIAFYSGFLYQREVVEGYVSSYADSFGFSTIDGTTVSIPASVITRPPYIDFYLEYPLGSFRTIAGEALTVGWDSNTIYFDGFVLSDGSGTAPFRIHYFISDRQV